VIEDVNKSLIQEASLTDVLVVDGKISKSGLNEINKDIKWLLKNLKIKNKKELKNKILAIYDNQTQAVIIHYKNSTK